MNPGRWRASSSSTLCCSTSVCEPGIAEARVGRKVRGARGKGLFQRSLNGGSLWKIANNVATDALGPGPCWVPARSLMRKYAQVPFVAESPKINPIRQKSN